MNRPPALIVTVENTALRQYAEHNTTSTASAKAASTATQMLSFAVLSMMGVAGFIGLYLVKSALGINLFAGPSFMHDLFYHLVR